MRYAMLLLVLLVLGPGEARSDIVFTGPAGSRSLLFRGENTVSLAVCPGGEPVTRACSPGRVLTKTVERYDYALATAPFPPGAPFLGLSGAYAEFLLHPPRSYDLASAEFEDREFERLRVVFEGPLAPGQSIVRMASAMYYISLRYQFARDLVHDYLSSPELIWADDLVAALEGKKQTDPARAGTYDYVIYDLQRYLPLSPFEAAGR